MGLYRGELREMIHRYKYEGALEMDLPLGRLLARRLRAVLPQTDLLLPVPLCGGRLRERGYNQALELCRVLSKENNIPYLAEAIERTKETLPLEGMGVSERRRSLKGVFRLRGNVSGQQVVLVDDVMTTGSTAREICSELRRGGASGVRVAVVARTPRRL